MARYPAAEGRIDSLRWEDVDGDAIRLRGENSKNGEGRTITVVSQMADLIDRRKAACQVKTANGVMIAALVFHHDGKPIVDFRKAWTTACKMSNVQGNLFHELRRTAIRNIVRVGVLERVAVSISGHKTRSIFDRYNIVSERDLREAMQRTQECLANAPQREQPTVIPQRSARTQLRGTHEKTDTTRTFRKRKRGHIFQPRRKSRIVYKFLVAGGGFEPPTFGL